MQKEYYGWPVRALPFQAVVHAIPHVWEASDMSPVEFGLAAGTVPELVEVNLASGTAGTLASVQYIETATVVHMPYPRHGGGAGEDILQVHHCINSPPWDLLGEARVEILPGAVRVTPTLNENELSVSVRAFT